VRKPQYSPFLIAPQSVGHQESRRCRWFNVAGESAVSSYDRAENLIEYLKLTSGAEGGTITGGREFLLTATQQQQTGYR